MSAGGPGDGGADGKGGGQAGKGSGAERPDLLAWWRSLPAPRLRRWRGELLSRLAALTGPDAEPALIVRALDGEAAAGVIIADALQPHAHWDLVVSWLAWAGAAGSEVAVLAVADELETQARRLAVLQREGELPPGLDEPGPEALVELAMGWRRLLSMPSLASALGRGLLAGWLEDQRQAEAVKAVEDSSGQEAGEDDDVVRTVAARARRRTALYDEPRLVVVPQIAETAGSEARQLIRAYEALSQPLPLAGASLDPDLLATALELEFPWLAEAIEAVRDELLLRRAAGVPWLHLRPLLLLGPPGVGKTRFARRLAQLAGTGHGELSAAGANDNRTLAGTARGWSSAQPAFPLLVIRRCGAANPVILVDEVDKARASRNGDLHATLLGLLEPETARAWHDECLLAPCDLSQVSWILTANSIAPLPAPLRSRLRIVEVGSPEPEHFEAVLSGVLRGLAEALAVTPGQLPPLDVEVIDALRAAFERSPDLRRLQAAAARALARAAGRRDRLVH